MLTLALMSHVFGARSGLDSTQPIKIEACSRKLILFSVAFRNERKLEADGLKKIGADCKD